jgi:hypothetical protein
MNVTNLETKVMNVKYVLSFSLHSLHFLYMKHFSSKKLSEIDKKMYTVIHVTYLLFLSDVNEK